MADYYTTYSFAIPDLVGLEPTWWKLLGEYIEGSNEGEDMSDPVYADFANLFDDPQYISLTFAVEANPGKPASLWVYTEESGSPEDAAAAVQAFLAKFRPAEILGFEWANTCSKPRLDSFGGGAALVTADEVVWFNPSRMLAEAIAARA